MIIAVIASISISAHAQWTDLNTFGLKGPVKVVYDKNNDLTPGDEISFTENGEYIVPDEWLKIYRDKAERIEQIGDYGDFFRFKYNATGNLTEFNRIGGNAYNATSKFTYNTKGLPIKKTYTEADFTATTTYTYQKIDSYGNWTKRTALTNGKRSVETRTITYYAPSQKPNVPDDILEQEAQGSKRWIVKNKDCKHFIYNPCEKNIF